MNSLPARTWALPRARLLVSAGAAVAFLVAYPILTFTREPSGVMAIIGVPAVILIGCFYGRRVGLMAGGAAFLYTILVMTASHFILGLGDFSLPEVGAGMSAGVVGLVGTGAVAGKLGGTNRRRQGTDQPCVICKGLRKTEDWIEILEQLQVKLDAITAGHLCPQCFQRLLEAANAKPQPEKHRITMCVYCHSVRKNDVWIPIERYVQELSVANYSHALSVSHGICKHCERLRHPGIDS
jgi:hypothetical protein